MSRQANEDPDKSAEWQSMKPTPEFGYERAPAPYVRRRSRLLVVLMLLVLVIVVVAVLATA